MNRFIGLFLIAGLAGCAAPPGDKGVGFTGIGGEVTSLGGVSNASLATPVRPQTAQQHATLIASVRPDVLAQLEREPDLNVLHVSSGLPASEFLALSDAAKAEIYGAIPSKTIFKEQEGRTPYRIGNLFLNLNGDIWHVNANGADIAVLDFVKPDLKTLLPIDAAVVSHRAGCNFNGSMDQDHFYFGPVRYSRWFVGMDC